ncbi:murein L,D-transpeptidase [Hymenobacter caeli]|uniref:Murein L,D-transpeptidase YcbB/YkuD n=1 Tax=Hymenobacter caeli TaxID=2735894 RepID=A0ABX2FRR8_9BACT|nr:L,D-transpeptidase family protein [Hymenobacter caeli]NRT19691.1 murein L,D-transpeptidase YcbB/YkuD [Hymenobacter caeli]
MPRFRFFHSFLVWLFGGLLGAALLSGCGSKSDRRGQGAGAGTTAGAAGPQPVLDSAYVQRALEAVPQFQGQLPWAKKFYRERQYQLGWFKNNALVPQAAQLLQTIAKARDEGLDPKKYQVKDLSKLFNQFKAAPDLARRDALEQEIDVALSGTYFVWASDFYRGVANPHDAKNAAWQVKPNKIKLHKALLTYLGDRKSKYGYYEFAPLHPEYNNLKKALAAYRTREAAGGWPALPKALVLRPGQASAAVPALRRRLLGPAAAAATSAALGYDPALVAAVKSFQRDAGLRPDGVVSGATLRELNVPIGQRIDQLLLNMERWRWLPKKFEPDYLLVNIPEYRLHVIEGGKEAMTMRVIVGKALTATPIFSDKMEYVVLAPYWNVPFSIIENELKDKFAADPTYLDRLDMEVVKGYGRKAVVIDPATIDWANVTQENFRYTLRRRPGPKNDLGNAKFIFPNSNDIYLHDTPHGELFSQASRNFSHGCVRVEEPIRLAAYLLRDKPGWDQQTILDSIATHRERYITLTKKLPVYLVYLTAWADADGHAHFRDDIYGHDKTLARELLIKPAGTAPVRVAARPQPAPLARPAAAGKSG